MAKTTQVMTPESEKRLLDALEKIADAVPDDGNPNEAIAKAASDIGIPAGHIHLLVNAYNTGRTSAQRQKGTSPWEKGASFPIADTEVILDTMFPEREKKASTDEVSSDYSMSPTYWLDRAKHQEKLAAAKSINFKLVDTPAPYPHDETRQLIKAASDKERQKKAVDEARTRASAAFDIALQETEELVEYFRKFGSLSYDEVKSNCERLYGEQATRLFDSVGEKLPSRLKVAWAGKCNPAKGEAYDIVDRCIEAAQAFQELRNDWAEKSAAFQATIPTREQASPVYVDPILGIEIPTGRAPGKSDSTTKEAGLWDLATSPMGPGLALSSAIRDESIKAKARAVTEPKPDMELTRNIDNIRRETMLNDLLNEDRVLAGHDPNKIIDAYKDLVEIAPMASMKRSIMRDFLRRRVEGGHHSWFDLEGLTKIEKNLKGLSDAPMQ